MIVEICVKNQWYGRLLTEAIHDAAVAEQAASSINGNAMALETICELIRIRWLDAMVPAGNA